MRTFTAAKVLDYENWLLLANSWRALVQGDGFIPLNEELYQEVEKAYDEYLKRKQDEEPNKQGK